MKNVLIVCNLFGNNRQGYDLASVLREKGCHVRLVQYADTSDSTIGDLGVRFVQPHGIFSKIHVLSNLLRVFLKSFSARRDIVVCIGRPLLVDAVVLAALAGAELVYYSLEYGHYTWLQSWIMRHCVRRYMDVEETRRVRVYKEVNLSVPWQIIYNLPILSNQVCAAGGLREYLRMNKGLRGTEKIVLYAGSYQVYSCLETIYAASSMFPDDVVLIYMVARGLPESCNQDTNKCKIVPSQSGQTFFDWLSDADCLLLPYESEDDFNVQNCSPQKLFDCYRAGVPYLASNRPLIRKVNERFVGAGMLCDFTNVHSIIEGVTRAIFLKKPETIAAMRKLYREEFNYSRYARRLTAFVLGEEVKGKRDFDAI